MFGFCPGVPVHKEKTIVQSLFRSHWLAVVYCLVYCEPVHEDRTHVWMKRNRSWHIRNKCVLQFPFVLIINSTSFSNDDFSSSDLKVLANKDTLLPTHCCRHIVADTNVSPFARARNICCGHKFCVRDTKNVSDFVQKHFVSATNVSQFAQFKKHHGQQCVRNNVSSFTRALRIRPRKRDC